MQHPSSSPAFPENKDPFHQFIEQLKPQNSLYCFSSLAGSWGLSLPPMPGRLMLHIVTAGQCLVTTGDTQITLSSGALVLLPQGKGHILKSAAKSRVVPFFDSGVKKLSANLETLEIAGEGMATQIICGVVAFDPLLGHYLLDQLPEIIVLESQDYTDSSWLTSTLSLIEREAGALAAGSETIITRLAEILIIQLIRHWLNNSPLANEGWFAAMRDKRIGAALNAIHQQPENKWTVDSLAIEACMSRSAFAARFTELLGTSVKNYLTKWRLTLAHYQLKQSKVPLIELALSCGYESEAAFSRAFKRVIGLSPSQARSSTTL